MQYTTDLENVYFHLLEHCIRSVFPKQLFFETFIRFFSFLKKKKSFEC